VPEDVVQTGVAYDEPIRCAHDVRAEGVSEWGFAAAAPGLAFSLFALGIAAFNFSLDFEFIEKAQKENLAKRMEWYAAFGVLVTLVWVYLEMLRLLSKLRSK
jgi:uncharacterized YccA/Bax inhibitor family protein